MPGVQPIRTNVLDIEEDRGWQASQERMRHQRAPAMSTPAIYTDRLNADLDQAQLLGETTDAVHKYLRSGREFASRAHSCHISHHAGQSKECAYTANLQVKRGAGDGNRTRVASLED